MKVKYGEVFVKHNNEDLWTNVTLWLGYDEETIISEDTTIIVEFDDKDIREVSNKSPNSNVNIEFTNDKNIIPSYFTIKHEDKDTIYFEEKPNRNPDGRLTLPTSLLFKNYKHYDSTKTTASSFTCIYYKNNNIDNIVKKFLGFSLIRIKSSISSPRYQIAYNADEFSKDEILYIINYLLKIKQPSQL